MAGCARFPSTVMSLGRLTNPCRKHLLRYIFVRSTHTETTSGLYFNYAEGILVTDANNFKKSILNFPQADDAGD